MSTYVRFSIDNTLLKKCFSCSILMSKHEPGQKKLTILYTGNSIARTLKK